MKSASEQLRVSVVLYDLDGGRGTAGKRERA